jgi:hypothetical protein
MAKKKSRNLFKEIKVIQQWTDCAIKYISETLKHINTIEVQNAKLKNIAWTQSHVCVPHFQEY